MKSKLVNSSSKAQEDGVAKQKYSLQYGKDCVHLYKPRVDWLLVTDEGVNVPGCNEDHENEGHNNATDWFSCHQNNEEDDGEHGENVAGHVDVVLRLVVVVLLQPLIFVLNVIHQKDYITDKVDD